MYESNSDSPGANSLNPYLMANKVMPRADASQSVLAAGMAAAAPDSAWSPSWGRLQNNAALDQFPINDDVVMYDFELQNPANSINWVSPSSDIWGDWDFRFTSMAHPEFAQSFAPVLSGQAIGNINTEIAEDSGPLHMAASNPHSGTITQSPRVETPHSTQPSRTPGASSMSVSFEDGLTPSPRPYVDSIGARGTLQKVQKKRTNSVLDLDNPKRRHHQPPRNLASASGEIPHFISWISQDLYNEMLTNIQVVGGEHDNQISLSAIPSLTMMNKLCQLYFNHFHPSFPFIRKSPFVLGDGMWLLVIAVVAVGAQYALTPEVAPLKEPLAAILRRGVATLVHPPNHIERSATTFSSSHASQGEIVTVVQARILDVLLLVHSGNAVTMERGLSEYNSLLVTNRRMHLLWPAHLVEQSTDRLYTESRIRTGYMIWVTAF